MSQYQRLKTHWMRKNGEQKQLWFLSLDKHNHNLNTHIHTHAKAHTHIHARKKNILISTSDCIPK